MKPEECKGCALYWERGPLSGHFTGDTVDVTFIGHAPTSYDIDVGLPFAGFPEFRKKLEWLGHSYGVTDAWKCMIERVERKEKQINSPDVNLYSYCLRWLRADLFSHRPRVVVPLGNAAQRISTRGVCNAYRLPIKFGVAERLGNFKMMPIMHPEQLMHEESNWRTVWEESWKQLKGFLEEDARGE